MSKVPSLEEIEKMMGDLWVDTPERTVMLQTGRGGAMLHQQMLMEICYPEKDKEEIKKEVEAMIWEDGLYEIGGEPHIKYLGLWDSSQEDGTFVFKIRGLLYLERWQDGYRLDYKIISEEEFEELKKNNSVAKIDDICDKTID